MRITWGKVIAVLAIIAMVGLMRAIDTGSFDITDYLPSVKVGE